MTTPVSVRSLLGKRDKSRLTRYGVCVTTIGPTRNIPMPDYWFDRVFLDLDGVATFFRVMSGGRRYVEWQIFDQPLLTPAQKNQADQGGAGATIAAFRNAAQAAGIPIASFDRFMWVIDDGTSSGGTTPSDSLVGALDFTPQLASHEMTHAFGVCPHADLATYDDYGDQFCVMSKGPVARSFENSRLTIVNTPFTHATTGPGICAPYLYVAGWLDYAANVAGIPTSAIAQNTGAAITTIFANQGAPPPGSDRRIALAVGDVPKTTGDPAQYWIEYRHPSGFDRKITEPVVTHVPDMPQEGVVVLHEVSFLAARCTGLHSYVRKGVGAVAGNRLEVPAFGVAVRVIAVDATKPLVNLAIDPL
jgi:hypothetical protein